MDSRLVFLRPPLASDFAAQQAYKALVNQLGLGKVFAEGQPMFPRYQSDLVDPETKRRNWLAHIPGPRRNALKRSENAFQAYTPDGSRTDGFVKVEVLLGKKLSTRHPRFISAKQNDYLLATGPDYYDWQKWFTAT